jgi:hypothetical protein
VYGGKWGAGPRGAWGRCGLMSAWERERGVLSVMAWFQQLTSGLPVIGELIAIRFSQADIPVRVCS